MTDELYESAGNSTVFVDSAGVLNADGAAVKAKAGIASYTKTYNTPARTIPAATAAAVATTASTNTSPYGYSQAQADGIVTAVNALEADVLALRKVVVALVTDLEALGLVG